MGHFDKIKEYVRQVGLGVSNFQFFRISSVPKLIKSFSELERKILLAALTALIVCSVFLGSQSYYHSTKEVPDYGGKYSEGIVGQPRYINPVLAAASGADTDLTRIIYSGLLKFSEGEQLVPDLATGMPEVSADGKQYTIKLRNDVLWHDKVPFNADDVVFTIHLLQNPAFQSPLRLNWNKVEVHKTDDYTIVITLKEPSAAFITSLTEGILPKHIWEGVDSKNFTLVKYNLQPVGTGPFMMDGIEKSDTGDVHAITLKSFPQYYGGPSYLNQIVFRFYNNYDELIAAYHSKDILGLGYIPFDKKVYVEKSSTINLRNLNLPQYQALFFNRNKSAVLADKNVRAALVQSLNRDEIIKDVYLGAAVPSFGPIPPGFLGYNPGVEKANLYDIDNAKKLLDQAGFKAAEGSPTLKKGEVPLEFTITTYSYPLNVKTAELLKKQWEAVGFKINLQILTIGELEQNYLRPREYQALLFSENVGADPDPFSFWSSTQRADPGLNLAMFNSKEADKLLLEARANLDPNYRATRYQRFQEILVDDIPAAFIVNSLFVYGVSTKVKGIELDHIVNPSERFLNIEKWYINTKRVKK